MRIQSFRYRVHGEPELLGELLFLAFKSINGYTDKFPVDVAGREPHWGKRKIRVIPENRRDFEDIDEIFPLNALKECNIYNIEISYSYQRRGKRGYATKDWYRVDISFENDANILTLTFTRLRGLGRTLPRFLVSLIRRKMIEISCERKKYGSITIEEILSG